MRKKRLNIFCLRCAPLPAKSYGKKFTKKKGGGVVKHMHFKNVFTSLLGKDSKVFETVWRLPIT